MAETNEAVVQSVSLPYVEIDEKLTSPESNYTIEVNREGIASLLKTTGVSDEDIPGIRVVLKKMAPIEEIDTFAKYTPNDKTITIYTDRLWQKYPIYGKTLGVLHEREVGKTNKPFSKNHFPELISGKRFTTYLQTAPKERALKLAERLQALRAGRTANEGIAHEAKHAGDDLTESEHKGLGRRILAHAAVGAGVVGILSIETAVQGATGQKIDIPSSVAFMAASSVISAKLLGKGVYYHFFDLDEKKARQFGKEFSSGNREKLITFTAK